MNLKLRNGKNQIFDANTNKIIKNILKIKQLGRNENYIKNGFGNKIIIIKILKIINEKNIYFSIYCKDI